MKMIGLHVDNERVGAVEVLRLEGELDLKGAEQFDREIDAAICRDGAAAVLVDLSQLEFMDSSGLRALVLADERIKRAGKGFALVPGAEPVQRVLVLTRMDRRLQFATDPAELEEPAET